MLFILDIIISLTQVIGREGAGVPCCGLKAKGVDMQSETGNIVKQCCNMSLQIKPPVKAIV
jgi:hypothetical protein